MTLEADGQVEISAAETGQVMARNTGEKTAAITDNRKKETVRIQPGETAVMR